MGNHKPLSCETQGHLETRADSLLAFKQRGGRRLRKQSVDCQIAPRSISLARSKASTSPRFDFLGSCQSRWRRAIFRSKSSISRGLPSAARFTSCLIITSRFAIFFTRPFCLTSTSLSSSRRTIAAKPFDPLGRPLGFPELPFGKRVCFGGLPYPTSYCRSFFVSSFILALILLSLQFVERSP